MAVDLQTKKSIELIFKGKQYVINKNWKELIKPKKIEFTKNQDNAKSAELVAEPLESGYGQTIWVIC